MKDLNTKDLILYDFHPLPTSGHSGVNSMLKRIQKMYRWSNMHFNISFYKKNYEKCQKRKKNAQRKKPLCITSTAETSFKKIFLGIVGPTYQKARACDTN